MSGVAWFAVVYIVGLVAIVLAGVFSPAVWVAKQAVFAVPTSGVATSASQDYVFPMSGYKSVHQSIFLSVKTNIPSGLQALLASDALSEVTATESFNVTVYGSPQPEGVSDSCPSGCVGCPDGNEEEGLSCTLLADSRSGSAEVTCESGAEWCSLAPLYTIDFVRHSTYYWLVERDSGLDALASSSAEDSDFNWEHEFEVVYVSPTWTGFQVAWFYAWLAATLLVMFFPGFGFFALAIAEGVRWSEWRIPQKWTAVLLVSLFFFNNPFFAAQIYSSTPLGFFLWYAVAMGLFVALALMCWMDQLFRLGLDKDKRLTEKEGLPRTAMWILSSLIFIDFTLVMIHVRLDNGIDPRSIRAYPSNQSTPEQLLAILCFVYCGWILALGCRAWCNGGGSSVMRGAKLQVLLLAMSAVTLLILVPSVIMDNLSSRVKGGASFCLAHGAMNLYVLMMALCDTPERARDGDIAATGASTAGIPAQAVLGNDISGAPNALAEEKTHQAELEDGNNPWWRGKPRPKIADSSAWEDARGGRLM